MKKTIAILLAVAVLLTPLHFSNAYDLAKAKNYLVSRNTSAWSVLGLVAAGHTSISAGHLKNISGNDANSYTTPVLAITAIGENPRTFGSADYVAKLKSFYRSGQIGDSSMLNDDIFGILALVSAGEKSSAEVAGAKNFLQSKQNSNGGWGWSTTVGSDTNMTGAAIAALISAGVSSSDPRIQKGLNYLKSAQNSDGGFPYDSNSSFGNLSDSSSTAWVVWALNAVGINASSWSKSGNTPISYLRSLQTSQGYFEYQKDASENSLSSANTAYALIALTGKTLPLQATDNSGGDSSSDSGSMGGNDSDGNGTATTASGDKFSFKIQGKNSTICQGSVSGPTALDIVRNATVLCSYTYEIRNTSFGAYLYRINNERAQGADGWLYTVNSTKPNIGASDYTLQTGDNVVWFYGNADDSSPSDDANNNVSASANLKVKIEQPVREIQRVISFSINPASIDFGTLRPGQQASRNVTLVNNGNVDLDIKTSVTGDGLFVNNLKVAAKVWQSFTDFLGKNSSKTKELTLSVPTDYAQEGEKGGEIIFWATPRD